MFVQRALLTMPTRRDAVKGTRLGGPPKTNDRQRREIKRRVAAGTPVPQVAPRIRDRTQHGASDRGLITVGDAVTAEPRWREGCAADVRSSE